MKDRLRRRLLYGVIVAALLAVLFIGGIAAAGDPAGSRAGFAPALAALGSAASQTDASLDDAPLAPSISPLGAVETDTFDGSVTDLPSTGPTIRQPIEPGEDEEEKAVEEEQELDKAPLPGAEDPEPMPEAVNAPAPGPGGGGDPFSGSLEGLDFQNWGAGSPPDPNGDVGPEYYIQAVNTSIGIFRKSDGVRAAAFTFNTFWAGAGTGTLCDTPASHRGDPVVVYDPLGDRWLIMDFAYSGNGSTAPYFFCLAVSKTGDPVNGGWYLYALQTNTNTISTGLPDYPKMGIWPDGLYITASIFCFTGQQPVCGANGLFKEARVWALNRQDLEAGGAVRGRIADFNTNAYFTVLPANMRAAAGTPPAGRDMMLATESQTVFGIHVFKLHVDYDGPGSTFTGPTNVAQASYSPAAATVPTPANPLDTLRERLMVQLQYSNLGGTESLWYNHTTRCCGTGTPAGIQWSQVNVTGGTISATPIQQQLYPPANDGLHRWMGSLAVDKLGDMALGYSVANATTAPDIRYAGRLAGDPLGTLPQTEVSLLPGITRGSLLGNCGGVTCIRWGDYSAMTLDPNGCDFWYTQEYYLTPDSLNWQTRIASMRLNPACSPTLYATTLTTTAATGTFGGTTNLSATLKRGTVNLSGKTVTFTLNGTPVGTATTNASGVATLTGASLAGIDAGSYPAGVGASFATDGIYDTSTASNSLTVDQASQTINVTTSAPASAKYGDSFTVAATASSGLAVSYSSAGSCTNVGATFTMTSGVGTCTVQYDQAGNNNYSAAPQVTESVTALPLWPFTGFFSPISNTTLNSVQAGTVVPVKFSLGGDRGLDIFASGYPKSIMIDCTTRATIGSASSTSPAGKSGLIYDATSGQYVYAWKTDKGWAGTCRRLVLEFIDDTEQTVSFQLKK